jgi:hypothetical protein
MLLALAVLSFVAALGCGTVAWRVVQADRERSAARVAFLASAIEGPATPATPVDVASLFARSEGTDIKGRPVIKAAVVLAMAAVLLIAVAVDHRANTDGGAAGTAAATRAATSPAAPLELTSMRHARNGSALTVTGLVHNPAGGVTIDGLSAVVLAFDRNGTFITSSRAPLELATLAPGDDSPFVVAIPNAGNVARYRVTFRVESGVVRHLDRRADPVRLAARARQ